MKIKFPPNPPNGHPADWGSPAPVPPIPGVAEEQIQAMIKRAWSPELGMPCDYWIMAKPLERALAERFFKLGYIAAIPEQPK